MLHFMGAWWFLKGFIFECFEEALFFELNSHVQLFFKNKLPQVKQL